MGIQTVTPEAIGRESTSVEWNKRAMANMREAGFEQCNIDLMYGFAKQQMKHVQASVEHALSLSPEFVTLYRMRYKRTGVEQKATEVSLAEVHEQYSIAKNLLASAGYEVRNGKNTFSKMP